MSAKLAHAIQSVKQWNKSAKEDMGTILFFLLEETDFILEKKKKTTKHPDKKTGWLGYVGCQ